MSEMAQGFLIVVLWAVFTFGVLFYVLTGGRRDRR